MSQNQLDQLLAVTQDSLEIDKLEAKKKSELVKIKRWEKIDEVVMNIIKYLCWPLVLLLAIFKFG